MATTRKLSVVVPVYHNSASLPSLLERLQRVALVLSEQLEFVFVDDGSADDSLAVLTRLAESEPRMSIIKLTRNFGSPAAVLAGLREAHGDAVAVMAADLQDPPELITEMMQRWREGYKVVLATRMKRRDPWLTRLTSSMFYRLLRRFALPAMPPGGFDFFLVDRSVADIIGGLQESTAYLSGLILWLGFKPAVIEYERKARDPSYGRSMWRLARRFTYFIDSFVAFSYAPLRIASGLGVGLALLGFTYGLVVVVARLLWGSQAPGFAALMVVLLLTTGVQLMMTGVLGEYVWRNLEETRQRPRFIVERVMLHGDPETERATDGPPQSPPDSEDQAAAG